MEKYKISDNIRTNIPTNADLGYTLVAYYKMEYDAKRGWLGKWIREDTSFKSVTDNEKEVIVSFCEWFSNKYENGYEESLIEYIKQERSIELPIVDKSCAVVRFISEGSGYSTRIQLYRKVLV